MGDNHFEINDLETYCETQRRNLPGWLVRRDLGAGTSLVTSESLFRGFELVGFRSFYWCHPLEGQRSRSGGCCSTHTRIS